MFNRLKIQENVKKEFLPETSKGSKNLRNFYVASKRSKKFKCV